MDYKNLARKLSELAIERGKDLFEPDEVVYKEVLGESRRPYRGSFFLFSVMYLGSTSQNQKDDMLMIGVLDSEGRMVVESAAISLNGEWKYTSCSRELWDNRSDGEHCKELIEGAARALELI